MPQEITARDLLKTEEIITCAPSATLSQALARLNSSHDAVFVAAGKKLLGCITPYYVMFRANYPPTTKVEHCLFSPPKLRLSTPIWEIAKQMVLAKVYFLPVVSEAGEWVGIVSVYSLLRKVRELGNVFDTLPLRGKGRLTTIDQSARLSEARELLRRSGVARLPVVDGQGKLIGILTRYDLRQALSAPKTSLSPFSRVGQKRKSLDQPIRNYVKGSVITATPNTPLPRMIGLMLEHEVGSVVIVNPKWQPIGILTYKDVLEAIARTGGEEEEGMQMELPEDFEDKTGFQVEVEKRFFKLRKKVKLGRLEVHVHSVKNAAGEAKLYEITLIAHHRQTPPFVAKTAHHDWRGALKEAMDKIESQARRGEAEH